MFNLLVNKVAIRPYRGVKPNDLLLIVKNVFSLFSVGDGSNGKPKRFKETVGC